MQVRAGLYADAFILHLLRRIFNKCCVGIGLIRRMIHNAVRAAGKGPDAVAHDIVHLLRALPLLQFHHNHVACVGSIRPRDHKIHALGSSGNLILDSDFHIIGDVRIIDGRTHKMQGILPGPILCILSPGQMLLPKLFQNFIGNQVQIYIVIKLCFGCAVDDHKVTSDISFFPNTTFSHFCSLPEVSESSATQQSRQSNRPKRANTFCNFASVMSQ